MTDWRPIQAVVLGTVAMTLLASGLGLGGSVADPPRDVLEEGNASVDVTELPADRVTLDDGRFGSGAYYLRAPDARVRTSDVTGTVRLVYRLTVPELGVEEVTFRRLPPGRTHSLRVDGPHRALEPNRITDRAGERYTVTLAVAVQSRSVYRTVRRANGTLEVRP